MIQEEKSIFETGYNRRQDLLSTEYEIKNSMYQPIVVESLEKKELVKPDSKILSESDSKVEQISFQRHINHEQITSADMSSTISPVYDRNNQLTSLVKNARQNKEALKKRNELISMSKQQQRKRYGW